MCRYVCPRNKLSEDARRNDKPGKERDAFIFTADRSLQIIRVNYGWSQKRRWGQKLKSMVSSPSHAKGSLTMLKERRTPSMVSPKAALNCPVLWRLLSSGQQTTSSSLPRCQAQCWKPIHVDVLAPFAIAKTKFIVSLTALKDSVQ